ncbi:MAG: hypothetical protein MNPFHGCM_00790 [Gemmatimonadaceae bacterium]|nr:hypothetical protein [Gemmatimonadaceae bacterium]
MTRIDEDSEAGQSPPSLEAFASERIVVLPLRLLEPGDAHQWAAAIPDPVAFLSAADSAFAREAEARGLGAHWVGPATLAAASRRNPTYATDPFQIRAAEAVRRLERNSRGTLAEPVASQLRVIAGLHDTRYALIPVELGFVRVDDGSARAVLHLALVDVRRLQLQWSGDLHSDPSATLTPLVLTSLARRVADLFVTR